MIQYLRIGALIALFQCAASAQEVRFVTIPIPDPFSAVGQDLSISNDGTRISLLRLGRDNFSAVWLYDVNSRRLSRIAGGSSPTISPNSERLLFSGGVDSPFRFKHTFYIIDPGEFVLAEFNTRFPSPFSLSEDGSRIAFRCVGDLVGRNLDGSAEIFLFDVQERSIRQITDGPRIIGVRPEVDQPRISQDGDTVVYLAVPGFLDGSGSSDSVNYVIAVYNNSTQETYVATPLNFSVLEFTSSFSGQRLAHLSIDPEQGPDPIVYLQDLPSEPTKLFDSGTFTSLHMSGDGRYLVFAATGDPVGTNADANFEVFRFDLDALTLLQASDTFGGVGAQPLAIDRDGSTIVARQFSRLRHVDVQPGLVRLEAVSGPEGSEIVISAPIAVEATEETRVEVAVSATSSSPVTFFLESRDKPLRFLAKSELHEFADGRATMVFSPSYYEAGSYQLRLAAFDERGSFATHDLTLLITDTDLGGDADCNGSISYQDVQSLISAIFSEERGCLLADADEDGVVRANDLPALLLKLD